MQFNSITRSHVFITVEKTAYSIPQGIANATRRVASVAKRVFEVVGEFFKQVALKVVSLFRKQRNIAVAVKEKENIQPSQETLKAAAVKEQEPVLPPQATLKTADFLSLTRYLPHCDKLLKEAELRKQEIDKLHGLLRTGNWDEVIHSYRKTPDQLTTDSLKAFERGDITMQQFTTLITCWSLMVDFPDFKIRTQPLFDQDGSIDTTVKKMIQSTLIYRERKKVEIGDQQDKLFLDQDQFELFFQKMKMQPESEKVFFFVNMEPYNWDQSPEEIELEILSKKRTIMAEVAHTVGVNVFHQFIQDNSTYRMVPSFSMMQQFLDVHSQPGDAVKITPVIGLSSVEDLIANMAMQTRDMGLPFPGVQLPKEADKMQAPYAVEFIAHDFYHSILASEIPHKLRSAFKDIVDAIGQVKKELADSKVASLFLQELYERVIDMEFPFFAKYPRPERVLTIPNITDMQKLFLTITFSQQHAVQRIRLNDFHSQECQKMPDKEKAESFDNQLLDQRIFDLGYGLRHHRVIAKIAETLHKQNFCAKYGVSVEDLKVLYQVLEQEDEAYLEILESMEQDGDLPSEFTQEARWGEESMPKIQVLIKMVRSVSDVSLVYQLLKTHSDV